MSIMPNAKFRKWAREDTSRGQPDETRFARARAFAVDVMEKIKDNQTRQEKVLVNVG